MVTKLEEFRKKKFQKQIHQCLEIYLADTNESFYRRVKVTKFQNPNKISQISLFQSVNSKLNNLNKDEIYFNETVYIIDINNLSIKEFRKIKKMIL